jgi:hypothetical protein
LKTVSILLSVLAIAAGMIVGWLEHEESRNAAATSSAEQVIAAPSPSPLRSEEPDRKRRSWRPGTSEIVSLDTEPESGPDSSAKPEARAISERPDPALPSDSRFRPRLDAVAVLIQKRSFAEAEKGAREIAEDASQPPPPVREAALRLAAKARVFGRILAGIPAVAGDAGSFFEVLLANGARIRAIEVDETVGHYVFKLPKGLTFSPAKEDVLEVRRATGKLEARVEWKQLAPKVASLTHPIDIFIGGVQPCFQNGLDREGFALLDKLLALPNSDQVPLLFIPDAGDDALEDWRLAAGRPAPRGGRQPGDRPAASDSGAPADPADSSTTVPDPQALVQVAEILGEAQALYRSGAGKEGREGEVRQARERLDRALELLEPLPAGHETVKKLRRQLAQLLSDVSRAGSF